MVTRRASAVRAFGVTERPAARSVTAYLQERTAYTATDRALRRNLAVSDARRPPTLQRARSLNTSWADGMARARKFLAFRVQLNETKVVTAGIPGPHVVSTIISSVVREPGRTTPSGLPMLERELELDVGGLVTLDEEHVSWVRAALKVGDRITIDVIETTKVDEPARRPRIPSKKPPILKHSARTPTVASTRKPKRVAKPR